MTCKERDNFSTRGIRVFPVLKVWCVFVSTHTLIPRPFQCVIPCSRGTMSISIPQRWPVDTNVCPFVLLFWPLCFLSSFHLRILITHLVSSSSSSMSHAAIIYVYHGRFSSNTTGDNSGAGTAYPSGSLELTPVFKWGSCYFIFYSFMFL